MALQLKRGEDEAGANLSKAEAQTIAENYLKTYHKLYSPFEFKDESETKRKNRTDYHFTFKVPKYKVGEADFELNLDVIGDTPCNLGHGWDVPDNWKWERAKQTKRQEISSIVKSTLDVVVFIVSLFWIVFLFKHNKIRWRRAIFLATLICTGAAINWLNNLTEFFNSYDSTVPLNTFYITSVTNNLVVLALLWIAASFGIAIVLAANSDNLKARLRRLLSVFTFIPQDIPSSKVYRDMWLDAIIMAGALMAACWLVDFAVSTLSFMLDHEVGTASISSVAGIANAFFGPLTIGMSLISVLVLTPLLIGLAIAVCRQFHITKYWRFCACITVFFILYNFGNRYWQDFLTDLISYILWSSLAWFSVVYVFKRNVLTLFIQLWIFLLYGIVYELWKFGWPTFSMEFILACTFLTYPFIYLLYLHARIRKLKPSS